MTPTDWLFDRTGFPYLPVPAARIAVALFPITKAQTELWLADATGPGDEWYEELLRFGPRVGWRTIGKFVTTQLVLTGLNPEEAGMFAAWLGTGYRLPTTAEWRAGDRAVSKLLVPQLLALANDSRTHPAAAGILKKLSDSGRRTAPSLGFWEGGVLEWVVRPTPPHGGLGRPTPDPAAPRLIGDPQSFDPVTLIRPGRLAAFGARLARPLELEGEP